MAKTRSKPGGTTISTTTPKQPKATLKTLDAPVSNPPQLVVLPKDASPEARIVSIGNSRYFICPEKGLYEFKSISASKNEPRSWLLAPSSAEEAAEEKEDRREMGYVLQQPNILLATPIDPLFLLLPSLAGECSSGSTEYLAPSDYLSKMSEANPHLTHILRLGLLEKILEGRMEAICDSMDMMGDGEKMYALSLPKLVKEVVGKARRMAGKALPRSMEERFVKGALDVPVLSVRREESGVSVGEKEEDSAAGAEESQESNGSGSTDLSVETAATDVSTTEDSNIAQLLRLRTALDFILRSYVPTSLAAQMEPLIKESIDWTPLTAHLERVAKLKKEAQAMRSIGENFSRKRALGDEDESREEIKKRKKEEEDKKKRGVSQGIKKLAKADRSGMKSLASFFGKK